MNTATEPEQKQLGFDFDADYHVEASAENSSYEILDYQLADLFCELFDKSQKNIEKQAAQKIRQNLRSCVLEISKKTREGSIAVKCTAEQQKLLIQTDLLQVLEDVTPGDNNNDQFKPLVLHNTYLYLRRYWQYQRQLFDLINARMHQLALTEEQKAWQKQHLESYFETNSSDADTDWQKLAAQRALENKFLIITGGPGTGKTTTIARILALLIEEYLYNKKQKYAKKGGDGFNILLAAPTGKAAIRMLDSIRSAQQTINLSEKIQEYLPQQASTLHKLLGYIPDSIVFKHNKNNHLKADIVLVDEASMIDIAMMAKLFEAVSEDTKLILIGDKDQLSSVETGSVFADLCQGLKDSNYLIKLQKNWRFSTDSSIGKLAISANQGDIDTLYDVLKADNSSECRLLEPEILTSRQIPESLIQPWFSYFELLTDPDAPISEIFQAFNQYRILCALRRGLNGSSILSERIEAGLIQKGLLTNHQNRTKERAGKWYHGRPVMITQNSYEKGLFNGDTGIVLKRNGQTKVYFPDSGETGYKSIAAVRLPAHETTWAMTIHKSQGSEFDQVTLVLPHEIMPLLTRQLIYTGITRAKKQVTIIASQKILGAGLNTQVSKATRIDSLLREN